MYVCGKSKRMKMEKNTEETDEDGRRKEQTEREMKEIRSRRTKQKMFEARGLENNREREQECTWKRRGMNGERKCSRERKRQGQRTLGARKQEKDKYIHTETLESEQRQKIFGAGVREKERATQKH